MTMGTLYRIVGFLAERVYLPGMRKEHAAAVLLL